MIYAIAIVALITGLLAVPLAQRLLERRPLPIAALVLLAVASATPVYTAYTCLQPGEPVASVSVAAMKDVVSLEIPPGHELMLTAELGPDEDEGKTAFALRVKGGDWAQNISGTIKRSGSGGGPDIDVVGGEGISESTTRRGGAVGEDLQERYALKGTGPVEITVTNYQGGAAERLALEVVKAPPPVAILWGVAGIVALVGLVLELRQNLDRYAGDVAAIACYGALMPQSGITPLDNIRGLAFAGLGAILLGQGAVAAVGWLSRKYIDSLQAAEAEKDKAPPPPAHRRR